MIIIKSEKDISQIKLGDQYIVDGPEDPEEFFDFLQKIDPLIADHINGLLKERDGGQQRSESVLQKEIRFLTENATDAEFIADRYNLSNQKKFGVSTKEIFKAVVDEPFRGRKEIELAGAIFEKIKKER